MISRSAAIPRGRYEIEDKQVNRHGTYLTAIGRGSLRQLRQRIEQLDAAGTARAGANAVALRAVPDAGAEEEAAAVPPRRSGTAQQRNGG